MSKLLEMFVTGVGTATLFLAVGTIVMAVALWCLWVTSPGLERTGWAGVLVLGWMFIRLTLPIPWTWSSPARSGDLDTYGSAVSGDRRASPDAEPITPREVPGFQTTTDQREPTTAAARESVDSYWHAVIAAVWVAGMLGIAAFGAWSYVRFVRGLPTENGCEPTWLKEWHTVLSRSGVSSSIPLIVTSDVGPALCRLPGRYVLVIPGRVWGRMTPVQRQAILAHELAHYQRGDIWQSLAVRILALSHWFNPCAWYAVRRFDECGEFACDAAAAAGGSNQTIEYAKALLLLGETTGRTAVFSPAAHGHGLALRVRRVLSGNYQGDSIMKKIVVLGIVSALVFGCMVRFDLTAHEPPSSDSNGAGEVPVEEAAAAPQDAAPEQLDRAQVFIGENFFVAAVRTPLQRRLVGKYKDREAIAYANINAKAFIVPGTGLIDSQSLEFAAVRGALRQIAEHQRNGQLRIAINYGYSPPSEANRQANHLLRETFEGMGRLAGFSDVWAHGSWWNDENYTWQPPKRMAHGEDGPEENVGTDGVQVYPVQTSLSHYLTGGADCYVILDSPPIDEWNEAYREAVRNPLETLPPDRRRKVTVLVQIPEREEDVSAMSDSEFQAYQEREIRAIQEGLGFQEGAVALLKGVGFEEIILNVSKGGNEVRFTYNYGQTARVHNGPLRRGTAHESREWEERPCRNSPTICLRV